MYRHSQETKKRISLKMTGRKLSAETKKRMSQNNPKYWLGKKHPKSKELIEKLSKPRRYKWKRSSPVRNEERTKISLGMMGNKNGLGHKLSEESKAKISKNRIGKYGGKNSPTWKGGISFEPYSIDWTETLKRSIRERDKYTCQLCGGQQVHRLHDIHHIDYNKKNCNPTNLITLCRSCHPKTNFNRRYWTKYFQNQIC